MFLKSFNKSKKSANVPIKVIPQKITGLCFIASFLEEHDHDSHEHGDHDEHEHHEHHDNGSEKEPALPHNMVAQRGMMLLMGLYIFYLFETSIGLWQHYKDWFMRKKSYNGVGFD